MDTKVREYNESRYVSDYILEHFADRTHKLNCPLYTVPEYMIKEMGLGKALRTGDMYRPRCDAVVIDKDKIIIIEGKIMKIVEAAGELLIYRQLAKHTPEFQPYKNLPIEARLITPHPPFWMEKIAKELDIIIDVWEPEWIQKYHDKYNRYWTSEERVERAKRKETLKGLGMR